MYGEIFEGVFKATESAFQMQQEMVRTWAGSRPGVAGFQLPAVAHIQAYQKKLADVTEELIKKHHGAVEAQFAAGQKVIEEVFAVAAAKDPDEFRARLGEVRARTMEFWKKGIEGLYQAIEARAEAFQAAATHGAELAVKPGVKATPVAAA